MVKCLYCSDFGTNKEELYLVCSSCNRNVHIECLKLRCVPGGLLGDTFFNFICRYCNKDGSERISRRKLSWFSLIILVLYNLHKRSEGVSRRGYFHWKSHICNFIDKHWNILFASTVKRKKSWMGTVSGTLSHFCPSFFLSGMEELKESGWWRMTHLDMIPQQIIDLHAHGQVGKKQKGNILGAPNEMISHSPLSSSSSSSAVDESSFSAFENTSSMDISILESEQEMSPSCSNGGITLLDSTSNEERKEVSRDRYQADLRSAFPDLFINDEHLPDMDVDIHDVVPLDFRSSCSDSFHDLENFLPSEHSYSACFSRNNFSSSILPDIALQNQDQPSKFAQEDAPSGSSTLNNSDKVNINNIVLNRSLKSFTNETGHESAKEVQEIEPVCIQSLFKHTPPDERIPPWKEAEAKEQRRLDLAALTNCVPVSEYEELQLLSQLRQASKTQELPGFARRLYRKLCVRQLKRQRGLPIFNLDNTFQKGTNRSTANVWMNSDHNSRNQHTLDAPILDRFYHVPLNLENKMKRQNCSFKIRLMGYNEPACFLSPYTQRQLKPFIRRDYETTPRWLRLLSEIEAKANKSNANWQPSQRYPIDYCYVRPQHISTVNSLCCEFFYPGIDLSETLQYPDFSCVVLYKKLVVAFAFMVPDSGYNETYITFLFTRPEWRGAGIATFMLYHLIQTCMGKDITLHVSATNPAVILYQKFGFKIEEFILDFYDKYFPVDSQECKHALFLRLSR